MIRAVRSSPQPRSGLFARVARTAAVFGVAGALALAGCSSPASSGSTGTDGGELKKMLVVTFLPLESFSFTPEMYAYSGGYFEKHGLDVQLQPVQGTAAAIQALLGGATPITRASTVDVFPAMEQGQEIRSIGTMAYKSNLRMVSVESEPITSTADMEGKTIGMGSVGGTSEKMLDLALDADGIPADSVTRQAVPVTAATLEVVRQGSLDGYIVSLDTSLAIEQQADDAVVDPAGLTDSPDIQTWITTADNLENPERVEELKAFLAAMDEAVQAVIDDAPNGFDNVLKTLRDSGDWSFPALADDDVSRAALEIYTTETWVEKSGDVRLLENDLDAWKSTYDTYAAAGLLAGGQDPLQWITNDYVPGG
ncbi:Riboflavin-binding protein RibY [Microbacterium lemovicicum]|uniref:Riboflavin-binding protein RibY n=1 Tax=Microbacterium lemovicicum TaxID=1072463 RepID=A0A3Q9J5M5_9MICO|nr:ABC transporter substrate-binding protein [Microbacterium lemovicicum]AZS38326.1 Riboflavin-binding protein RibY [Microbacterium lemovicicum]